MSRRLFLSFLLSLGLVVFSFNLNSPAWALGGKLPTLNQPAPNFSLPTNSGEGKISLSDYQGKWIVLYFYPKDFTSGCTLEARRFQQDLPKYLAKNTQILGVSADDIQSHAEFCDSEELKFPLLADVDGTVSKSYGSWINFISKSINSSSMYKKLYSSSSATKIVLKFSFCFVGVMVLSIS